MLGSKEKLLYTRSRQSTYSQNQAEINIPCDVLDSLASPSPQGASLVISCRNTIYLCTWRDDYKLEARREREKKVILIHVHTLYTPSSHLPSTYRQFHVSWVKDGEHNYAAQSFAETSQRGQVSLKVQLSWELRVCQLSVYKNHNYACWLNYVPHCHHLVVWPAESSGAVSLTILQRLRATSTTPDWKSRKFPPYQGRSHQFFELSGFCNRNACANEPKKLRPCPFPVSIGVLSGFLCWMVSLVRNTWKSSHSML